MGTTAVLSAIFTLLAGIGIFLIACQMMSTNLESASSDKLKKLFAKASKSKLLGVGIGTFGTAAIQSSGATTVMTIGFVNAGIISLSQAATIIYGANIGTTITAQIVALGMFGGSNSLSTTIVFSAFAGVGAFMALFSNKSTGQTWGGILSGFGMLFVGLSLMSSSMSDFASLDGVKTFLAAISNPILLVLIGAIFTAIIQSSSVMTSIALTMVVTGLINLEQGIFLTMGSNIGSCVVAILAGMASGKNAKRTALIHLLFNCSGVVIFLFVGWILNLVSGGSFNFGVMFERMFPAAPQTQLAMFHTFFNVITVLIILPLNDFLVSLVCKAIPDSKEVETVGGFRLKYVDDNMLRTPPLAVAQTKREIIRMADLAMENFDRAINIITTLDFKEYDEFNQTEEELNFINRSLVDFVVKLSNKTALSEHDHIYLSTTFRSIRDLERVGDYAENIVEYARDLSETGSSFSPDARNEIYRLKKMIEDLFSNVMGAYTDEDMGKMAQANVIEEQIDDFTKMMEDNHVARMNAGVCTPSVGVHYLELSSDTERIADHLINVAKSIRSLK
ncbi:MAG: Na/Pi cotransporter family protein [Bacteroides sp.]|nr:Na/Pi cotransporter family protein [Bacteroidales bacterium]MCI6680219.1 Na/Pi cotransporter family protein [Bacteroides sp.]MDD7489580.1 Na/Pi cotransporter family protein [Bacteroides sp.]MDY5890999.1 Na/Pi cotransporter family protein [Candidatus Cryptobacteroides sp.]